VAWGRRKSEEEEKEGECFAACCGWGKPFKRGFADRTDEPGDFHSGELLRCRRIFLFMNRMFYSLQKRALRLAFHPL